MANDPQMRNKSIYSIIEQNNKFVVTKNGQPIHLPSSRGPSIITAFDTMDDAKEYLSILKNLIKSK